MKTFCLFVCFGIISGHLFSQGSNKARMAVYYKYAQVLDTNRLNDYYRENMVLYLGNDRSVFKSRDGEISDSLLAEHYVPGTPIQMRTASPNQYFKFFNQNKLATIRKFLNNYLIEDTIPHIKWKLTNETKVMFGYHCQKAIGRFGGRTYDAWFTTDIPIQNGPWKLGGLPGLIIEAHDTKNQVIFSFAGMNPKVVGKEIILPPNTIKTTEAQFAKILEAAANDPEGFIQNAPALQGKVSDISIPNAPKRRKPNNPIELPDHEKND